MNDIEKQIEDSFKNDSLKKEDDNINNRINHRGNKDKNKKIIYILLFLAIIIIISLIVYLMINKRNNLVEDNKPIENKEEKDKENQKEENIGYVSCDDNTSLLNVRNSTTGDIIDGLSCYQKITIEEELDKTDNCDKWYKVTYKKHDNNYTGYVCSTYIKKINVDESTYKKITELISKANDYYDKTRLMPYCGKTTEEKKIKFTEGNGTFEGEYWKSEFKSLEELRNYLLDFMDNSLIDTNLKLSDYNNPKMYDNYYEIDGNLYCRGYSGKGYRTLYTGNYNLEIANITDSRIDVNIAYEYITEKTDQKENNKCTTDNLSSCKNSDFEYKLGKIVINKKEDKYIINKMDFHE